MTKQQAKELEEALRKIALYEEQNEELQRARDHIRELQNGLEHMENLHKQELARSHVLQNEIEEMSAENTQLSEQNDRFIDEIRNLRDKVVEETVASKNRIKELELEVVRTAMKVDKEKGIAFHHSAMLYLLINIVDESTPYLPKSLYKKYTSFLEWHKKQLEFAGVMYGLEQVE